MTFDAEHFNQLLEQVTKKRFEAVELSMEEVLDRPSVPQGTPVDQDLFVGLSADSTDLIHRRLGQWLERDTWTPVEALTMISGFDPGSGGIKWDLQQQSMTALKPTVVIAELLIEGAVRDFLPHKYDDGAKSLSVSIIEDSQSLGFNEAVASFAAERGDLRQQAFNRLEIIFSSIRFLRAQMLTCISQRWFSSPHDTDDRQHPSFFVQWAESIGFRIEWAGVARQHGLIKTDPNAELAIRSSEESGQKKNGSSIRWTKEEKQGLIQYLKKHKMKEAVAHYNVSGARLRQIRSQYLAEAELDSESDAPAAKKSKKHAEPFDGLGGANPLRSHR